MPDYRKASFLFILIFFLNEGWSQSLLDSAMQQRNNAYLEYKHFRETMGERTWLNLVNLNKKAQNVLEIDNDIINNSLNKQLQRNKQLTEQINRLNLEISLLKKEDETLRQLQDERNYFFNILLIIASVFILLFVVSLILFIDRQMKYKSTKLELERFWTDSKNTLSERVSEQEISGLKKQINDLNYDKNQLEKEVNELKNLYREKEKALKNELNAKKQVEEEIKNLINQIKNH